MTQIESLTEKNFQEFLNTHKKVVYVYESPEYEYSQHFPALAIPTRKCIGIGKFTRQC